MYFKLQGSVCRRSLPLQGRVGVSLLHHQPEPVPMNIYDLDLGVFFQVFAQLGNIYVHTAAVKIGIAPPDALQGLLSRQKVIHVFAQHFQQLVLFGRKRLGFTIVRKLAQLGIEMIGSQIVFLVLRFTVQFFIAFEDRFYFMQQHFAVKGLGNIIVSAELVPQPFSLGVLR